MNDCEIGEFIVPVALAVRLSAAMIVAPVFASPWFPSGLKISLLVAVMALGSNHDQGIAQPIKLSICKDIALFYAYEFLSGLILGIVLKISALAVETACGLVAATCGLSNAFVSARIETENSDVLSTLYSFAFVFVLLSERVDVEIIRAISTRVWYLSYRDGSMIAGLFYSVLQSTEESFRLSLLLAAPVLVLSIVGSLVTAIVNRLLPQAPIYFAIVPFNIVVAVSAFSASMERPILDVVEMVRRNAYSIPCGRISNEFSL